LQAGENGEADMEGRDMKRLFELLAEVVDHERAARPEPEVMALIQAARRLEPDLDCLLAMRLLALTGDAPGVGRRRAMLSAL
jgi:hypothetical protein